jgi:NADH-quinone oxidoreductase subunit C
MPTAALAAAIEAIRATFTVTRLPEFRNETTLVVRREDIKDLARFCKEHLGFTYLLDISSVDNFGDEPRFEMVYELYHFEGGDHLRLKFSVSEEALEVPTVSDVWRTANWHEREIYDMMGIKFSGHPDLRRILMWDGYPYFPLRKDFPLAGKPSEMPDVAFSKAAPLEGGPFVTVPSTATTKDREPRSRAMD